MPNKGLTVKLSFNFFRFRFFSLSSNRKNIFCNDLTQSSLLLRRPISEADQSRMTVIESENLQIRKRERGRRSCIIYSRKSGEGRGFFLSFFRCWDYIGKLFISGSQKLWLVGRCPFAEDINSNSERQNESTTTHCRRKHADGMGLSTKLSPPKSVEMEVAVEGRNFRCSRRSAHFLNLSNLGRKSVSGHQKWKS